jgi:putative colanic acid biosynthesis acetyltransferase WcaF
MDNRRPTIDLTRATRGNFKRTWPLWYEFLWMVAEAIFVSNPLQVSSRLRVAVLRLFGAKIGRKTVIRNVHIKFPWKLEVGDHSWLGERVWIHNQDRLTIGCNTVISQESFITTGSHDLYRTMDLITKPVRIGDGVWITSRCIVQMGVVIGDNAVVTPGSVVHQSLAAGHVYGGNPVSVLRPRWPDEDRASRAGDEHPEGSGAIHAAHAHARGSELPS